MDENTGESNYEENSIEKSSSETIDVTEKEMLKQLIEKQNKQEKINKEIIENQQKLLGEQQRVIEKLQSIQDGKSGWKREFVDNDDSIDNPAKRADLDISAVDESERIANEHNYSKASIPNENPIFEKTGKCFALKHVFKNVSKLENNVKSYSEEQEHFGIIWSIRIYRKDDHLAFHLSCNNRMAQGPWAIKADFEVKFSFKDGKLRTHKHYGIFEPRSMNSIKYGMYSGWDHYKTWKEVETDLLINDSLTIEVSFKIKNMTGIYKDNFRYFDDPEFSDIVLVVQNKKFHVLKLFLATHSSYFKAMFLGLFEELKKSEIKLKGIDADDFQKYLEVLYGDDAIDDYDVEGILVVADMYDTRIVIQKCQKFLMKKSKKTLKKKLELSVRYNLEELKKKCLSQIKTVEDIRRVIPEDIEEMDHSIMAQLLKKALVSNTVPSS